MNGDLNRMLAEIGEAEGLGRTVARYGVRLAIDMLQTLLADLEGARAPANARAFLEGLGVDGAKRRGRPPKALAAGEKNPRRTAAGKHGWPADPAERSKEMKRRLAVAKAKQAAREHLHPRDPEHPGHEAWLAKMRKAGKKNWNRKSAAQRKQLLASMQAGKTARAALVNGAAA